MCMRRSFGKVYQGWWRGGSVAIKVVPHEGELGGRADALRESLLCSNVQHPNIVRPLPVPLSLGKSCGRALCLSMHVNCALPSLSS
jgi:hypothetical protein